jgi:hypothetical protein
MKNLMLKIVWSEKYILYRPSCITNCTEKNGWNGNDAIYILSKRSKSLNKPQWMLFAFLKFYLTIKTTAEGSVKSHINFI